MAMARQALADHLSIEHIERGNESGRSMPQIIMRAGATAAAFHGQAGLSSIQGLNLVLFIDTQHQRFIGWIEVKSDHIGQLFHKGFVARKLEAALEMRLYSPCRFHNRCTDRKSTRLNS